MAYPTINIDPFNAIYTLVRDFREKARTIDEFRCIASHVVVLARDMPENDSRMPLVALILGGVLVESIKRTVKGEPCFAYSTRLVNLPRATIKSVVDSLNGTDRGGSVDLSNQQHHFDTANPIESFFAVMDMHPQILQVRREESKKLDWYTTGAKIGDPPARNYPDDQGSPATHLYVCFMVYLREFGNLLDFYLAGSKSRLALFKLQQQLMSRLDLVKDRAGLDFPMHKDALPIAMGIEKTMKKWTSPHLKRMVDIAPLLTPQPDLFKTLLAAYTSSVNSVAALARENEALKALNEKPASAPHSPLEIEISPVSAAPSAGPEDDRQDGSEENSKIDISLVVGSEGDLEP